MAFRILRSTGVTLAFAFAILVSTIVTRGQQPTLQRRQFPRGSLNRIEDLPVGRLRSQIELLPIQTRDRAVAWLGSFHFTELDLDSLEVDSEGGIFYSDAFSLAPESQPVSNPPVAEAAVPTTPFPTSLVFHSRSGAPNALFLNFSGESVTNTAWNTSLGRSTIPAVVFSTDSDFSTFSDSEQLAIKRIWQRISEDYAPFDVDVTTERPASLGTHIAEALITRNTDANGDPNPSSTAGGVAYVNVFGNSSYSTYRPAWIYFNNLANNESYVAEAASHECGHNFGLSHDGKTDGAAYYGGHGSGDTSWGPIMGTGYNRNVSQWSDGEYYLANNTQDDLAIIAGKISYRADDHGDTPATATPLIITGGTNVVSTTPETDPANTNSANKGVLERNTDIDVFSFVTGNGPISLAVNPWIEPSGTSKGGNLDVLLELYDLNGNDVLTNNPSSKTAAQIQTTLAEGRYFLYVRNTGTGDPFGSTPTGYTAYGSIGQYFISGYVQPSSFVAPPIADLQTTDVTLPDAGPHQIAVTYADDLAIDVSTIDGQDIRVTGPNGYDQLARFLSVDASSNGTPRVATYAVDPASGSVWTADDNGSYTIVMQASQVRDVQGATVASGQIGQFNVNVPTPIYTANLESDPGWTLEPLWEYGRPSYSGAGPASGFTGTNIIGYNLSGNYQNNLSTKYATTPIIDCSGYTNLLLQFQRWLRLRSGDTAVIQASTNGTTWSDVWSTTQSVADTSWQRIQYSLPASLTGSASLQLRWGISSGATQNDIGWNLDEVQVFGGGNTVTPPDAMLTVTVNDPAWGTVSPPSGAYRWGSSIPIRATPSNYFQFVAWIGDYSSTNDSITVVLNTNVAIQAVFGELVTTNHATPYWWLASYGHMNDFDNAETLIGANGIPLWQSYLAGLNPDDPNSQVRLTLSRGADAASVVLNWNTVPGRVYTIWSSTNLIQGFSPLSAAGDLPATIQSFTNSTAPSTTLYRVEIRKP